MFTTFVAALVGSLAGYLGGWPDRIIMWIVDLLLVVPSFIIIAVMSPRVKDSGSIALLIVLLTAFGWMITARMVRGLTLSLREREFVAAARYMGAPTHRVITTHIVPNIASILIIDTTLNVGAAILAETGLSYLGFGVQPPDVSLGSLIATGTSSALTYPWLFLFAGGLLVVTVLCANVVGDGLRDAFDPNAAGARRRAPRRNRPVSGEPARRRRSARELPRRVRPNRRRPRGRLRGTRRGGRRHRRGIGSGKSVSSLAVLGLLPDQARVTGSIRFQGRELLGLGDRELSRLRGAAMSMVFQDPLSALTPVYRVGDQIAEALLVHRAAPDRTSAVLARWSCSSWWVSRTPPRAPRPSRTSSPGVCGSGW